jgi:hypothetical protein
MICSINAVIESRIIIAVINRTVARQCAIRNVSKRMSKDCSKHASPTFTIVFIHPDEKSGCLFRGQVAVLFPIPGIGKLQERAIDGGPELLAVGDTDRATEIA